MADHVSDWGDSLNLRRRGGKRLTMVMMFVGGVFLNYSYCGKPMGREFFVPVRTLTGVNLSTKIYDKKIDHPIFKQGEFARR